MGVIPGCEGRFGPEGFDESNIKYYVALTPRPEKDLVYGTAGFRCNNELLDACCLRMGMLAVLRAVSQGGPVGIMVTASHNGPADNGLKLADYSGGMLDASWEKHCTALANTDDVVSCIRDICRQEGITSALEWEGVGPSPTKRHGGVFIGRDTRDSSSRLNELCKQGIKAMGGHAIDIGVVTTPQLHHVVYSHNRHEGEWASVDGYFKKISDAYLILLGPIKDTNYNVTKADLKQRGPLWIDCANGVGALHLQAESTSHHSRPNPNPNPNPDPSPNPNPNPNPSLLFSCFSHSQTSSAVP